MTQRNYYFDFLRGVAILFVIGIHTFILGKNSIVLRQILNTAVPIFVAISGFFLSQKQIDTKSAYISFIKKQIPKVYFPVLLWSTPLLLSGILQGRNIITQIAQFFTCGYSIYYFVAFIIQCYIVLPIVTKAVKKNETLSIVFSAIMSCCWIMFAIWWNTTRTPKLPLLLFAGPLPCWIMFFVLGVVLGKEPERNYKITGPVIILILGLVLSVLESRYLYNTYGTGAGIKVSAFIYSFGAVLLLFAHKTEKIAIRMGFVYNFITYVGELSFGVYLIHCYFLRAIKLLNCDIWGVRLILTLLVTVIAIIAMRKIIPSKFHKIIGI